MTGDVPALIPVPTELLERMRSAQTVAIAGHVTPDADCIGSIGALWLALPELGVTPVASLPPASVARRLRFLAEESGLKAAVASEFQAADLLIAVDTAKQPRLNIEDDAATIQELPILNIDHHASNTRFGAINYIDGHRSSTAEMIYEVLTALGCQITPAIATLLFAGIYTDTQGFGLTNTTPRSLDVAHRLAQAGARIHAVAERLQRSQTMNEFALLKTIYANTRVAEDGQLAWSTASFDEIHAAGCSANDIEDQVEIPRSIEGVRLAILLTEGNRGKIRINFRGEGGLSVLELAKQFNGGGHRAAAGAILDGTIAEISERVVAAAREHLHQSLGESAA
jgi:phosphoesterase RecJ-like protein